MSDSPTPRPAAPSRDVETRADVRTVVRTFYRDIADDPLLGPYFDDVDLDAHIPTLVDFWSSVLFQTGTYHGRPFDPHAALDGLEARHFRRWLHRFTDTVDAHFRGPQAEQMKARARQIATIFQTKLGCLDEDDVAQRFASP